ncbi:Tim17/Tim22/Tim23/Pmp24 family-domain-containing protein [Gilbertella persicaria]|uniref:Tim17/Tim22/Tim23/Pmp24 family-domain-containing protein n=1 Tax=Gilbertella persicaria TaxID=101096 RepID=UPI0022208100|nr:Tim17/Tim22/Tim23/Pmp24 family-domain-containing protein [Gilbertella persicaria]KAI8056331.1 Tim17/Tim22/Tim23/Pmp24 family-domain-containing protein [Gilbertella persicaria]
MDLLNQIVLDPKYHDILSVLKGFRSGIVYGTKVRFPHALVMTVLFKTGSLESKVKGIFKATKQHAQNLGMFATIYKTLMIIQRKTNGGKEASIHPFIAGVVGGYYVFGENNSINQQIILYLFSRVVLALVKVPVKRQIIDAPQHTYPVFAAVVWGIVMWLFRYEKDTIQPSLRASMQYIYRDSDTWSSFKTLLWHNK